MNSLIKIAVLHHHHHHYHNISNDDGGGENGENTILRRHRYLGFLYGGAKRLNGQMVKLYSIQILFGYILLHNTYLWLIPPASLTSTQRLIHGDVFYFAQIYDFYVMWNIQLCVGMFFLYQLYQHIDHRFITILDVMFNNNNNHHHHHHYYHHNHLSLIFTPNQKKTFFRIANMILNSFQGFVLFLDLWILNILIVFSFQFGKCWKEFLTIIPEASHTFTILSLFYSIVIHFVQLIFTLFNFIASAICIQVFVHVHIMAACIGLSGLAYLTIHLRANKRLLLRRLLPLRQLFNDQHRKSNIEFTITLRRFICQNLQIFQALFIQCCTFDPLFGVYVLGNFPLSAYLLMLAIFLEDKTTIFMELNNNKYNNNSINNNNLDKAMEQLNTNERTANTTTNTITGAEHISMERMLIYIVVTQALTCLLGMHYFFAKLSNNVHSSSPLLLQLAAVQQCQVRNFRATLSLALNIARLHTGPVMFGSSKSRIATRYGYHYGPAGLITMQTFAKVSFV